jgi:hypothetical protein
VVEPLGLLARKRQTCCPRGVKSFIIALPMPEPPHGLKVDTTPTLQHLPSKVKQIEYCDE